MAESVIAQFATFLKETNAIALAMALAIGDVLGATVDFVIVAWVLYVVVGKLLKIEPAKK